MVGTSADDETILTPWTGLDRGVIDRPLHATDVEVVIEHALGDACRIGNAEPQRYARMFRGERPKQIADQVIAHRVARPYPDISGEFGHGTFGTTTELGVAFDQFPRERQELASAVVQS